MSFGPFFAGEVYTLTLTIKDKDTGAAVNLTGQAVKVLLRKRGATTNRHADPDDDAVISDGVNGIITYLLPSAWLAAKVPAWTLQVQRTVAGTVRKTEKISFPHRAT